MFWWRRRTISSAWPYGTKTAATHSFNEATILLDQSMFCIYQTRSLLRGEWSTTDTKHSSHHPFNVRDSSQKRIPSECLRTRGPFWISGFASRISRRDTRVSRPEEKSPTWISTGSPSAKTCWFRNCAPTRGWRLARSAPIDASSIGRLAPFTILGSAVQTGNSLWTKSSAPAPTANRPAFASV